MDGVEPGWPMSSIAPYRDHSEQIDRGEGSSNGTIRIITSPQQGQREITVSLNISLSPHQSPVTSFDQELLSKEASPLSGRAQSLLPRQIDFDDWIFAEAAAIPLRTTPVGTWNVYGSLSSSSVSVVPAVAGLATHIDTPQAARSGLQSESALKGEVENSTQLRPVGGSPWTHSKTMKPRALNWKDCRALPDVYSKVQQDIKAEEAASSRWAKRRIRAAYGYDSQDEADGSLSEDGTDLRVLDHSSSAALGSSHRGRHSEAFSRQLALQSTRRGPPQPSRASIMAQSLWPETAISVDIPSRTGAGAEEKGTFATELSLAPSEKFTSGELSATRLDPWGLAPLPQDEIAGDGSGEEFLPSGTATSREEQRIRKRKRWQHNVPTPDSKTRGHHESTSGTRVRSFMIDLTARPTPSVHTSPHATRVGVIRGDPSRDRVLNSGRSPELPPLSAEQRSRRLDSNTNSALIPSTLHQLSSDQSRRFNAQSSQAFMRSPTRQHRVGQHSHRENVGVAKARVNKPMRMDISAWNRPLGRLRDIEGSTSTDDDGASGSLNGGSSDGDEEGDDVDGRISANRKARQRSRNIIISPPTSHHEERTNNASVSMWTPLSKPAASQPQAIRREHAVVRHNLATGKLEVGPAITSGSETDQNSRLRPAEAAAGARDAPIELLDSESD